MLTLVMLDTSEARACLQEASQAEGLPALVEEQIRQVKILALPVEERYRRLAATIETNLPDKKPEVGNVPAASGERGILYGLPGSRRVMTPWQAFEHLEGLHHPFPLWQGGLSFAALYPLKPRETSLHLGNGSSWWPILEALCGLNVVALDIDKDSLAWFQRQVINYRGQPSHITTWRELAVPCSQCASV